MAEVPSLPGCHTQGETREQAMQNIQEAIESYIASLEEYSEHIPDDPDTQLRPVSGIECIHAFERAGFKVTGARDGHVTMMRIAPPSRVVIPKQDSIKPGMLRNILRHADMMVEEFLAFLR